MIGKRLYILLLLVALCICLFLFESYSNLLDFFPWGDNKAYVVWEPLVVYSILPAFFTIGIITVLVSSKNAPRSNLVFLAVGALLALPVMIGFDLETDLVGRWAGVLSALGSACLIVLVIYDQIRRLTRKHP